MQTSLRGHDRSHWSACFLQIILHRIIILHINSWPDSQTEESIWLSKHLHMPRGINKRLAWKTLIVSVSTSFMVHFISPSTSEAWKHLYACNDDFDQTIRSFQGLLTTKDKHPDYSWTLPSMWKENITSEWSVLFSSFLWVGRWYVLLLFYPSTSWRKYQRSHTEIERH